MKQRTVAAGAAAVGLVTGGWIALGGFGALEAISGLSLSAAGAEAGRQTYAVLALARAAGAAIAALSLVILALAWTPDRRIQALAAVGGGGFATLVVLIQQAAIWGTTVGWLLVGALALLTLSASRPLIPASERSDPPGAA